MSAVFREMTCLCTNAALFCSEPACPRAAPLHFWLTLPFRARRAHRSSADRGGCWRRAGPRDGQGHRSSPASCRDKRGGLSRPRSSFSAPAGSRKAGDPLCFLRNLFSSQAIKQVSSDTQHSQSKGTEMGPGEPRPASPASRDPREGQLTPLPQAHAGQSPSG